ncbi:phosphatase PAP2 family protein [Hyalangium sp.]|uniref:phosphatase PAP2 family protein n=1 Tax=Hyalangium sp. TaxID=2028555 RepID=UPI002D35F469|nr:phosphatase PAP2 family protein [Hyalangium sp.]HYH94491.1 phosphatase PAP2 family protein [Hyalangium sp.]
MRWRSWLTQHPVGRLVSAGVVIAAGIRCYAWLNRSLPPRFDFTTPLDTAIPFLPWTFPAYWSFFVLLLVVAWQLHPSEYSRGLRAVLWVLAVCFTGFILFTAHYPRPDVESIASPFWREEFRWLWSKDLPGNTFPSVHVAITVLGLLRLWRRRGRVLWAVWATLICLSTLTVKQHFVVDVLGGLVVGLAVHAWVFRGLASSASDPGARQVAHLPARRKLFFTATK